MQEKGVPEENVRMNIGDAARIFNLPTSTLRHWQAEGLLSPKRNRDNQYRSFSFDDVIAIGDVVSFRNLNIPLSTIREMQNMDMGQLNTVFLDAERRLGEQMAQLEDTRRQVRERLNMLAQVKSLIEDPYAISVPHVRQLFPKHYYDPSTWRKYFAGKYQFGFLVRSRLSMEREYGWVNLMGEPEDEPLWEYIDRGQRYAECLARVAEGDRDNNDIPQHLEALRKMGYTTGDIIAEYVVTALNGIRYDYYKVWIEVE